MPRLRMVLELRTIRLHIAVSAVETVSNHCVLSNGELILRLVTLQLLLVLEQLIVKHRREVGRYLVLLPRALHRRGLERGRGSSNFISLRDLLV